MSWQVRHEGSPNPTTGLSAHQIAEGLHEGIWEPTDEVRGPGEAKWTPMESHPVFEQAVADYEMPPRAHPDETHLDMNPLIDVCLVLLIFFILTITYASLERAISIPEDTPDSKGPAKVDLKDIRDRIFLVTARMEGDKVVVRIEKKEVPVEQIGAEMKQIIDSTGRREMVLDMDKDVPWGVETAILDAAKGNGVNNIINNFRRR